MPIDRLTGLLAAGITGAALLVAAPAMAQQNDLATYCKADIDRLCKGIAPGGGRLMKCLKSHTKEMSVGCAQALQKMKNG